MAGKIKLGTPIKAWKDVKTSEVKTFSEWIKDTVVEENEVFYDSRDKIEFYIITDRLLPIT